MRQTISAVFLYMLLLISILSSARLGYVHIPFHEIIHILFSGMSGPHDTASSATAAIIMDIRIPRIIAAALVGGALGVSGTVFQALLLNPLADPYTLGISSGAAFGASLAIVLGVLGICLPKFVSIPLLAFTGAMGSLFIVMGLASGSKGLSSTNLILAGVIVSAILSAAIGFMKFLADEQVGAIIFWLMGSFSAISWDQVLLMAVVTGPCIILVQLYSRELNVVATGEKTARSMGIDTARLRVLLLGICSFWTAIAVSISGIIGFVGLIVPHLLRHWAGPDNRWLAILSFPTGALLLLAADTVTRAILPAEVPIGVLTALIGGPFFCFIFKRRQVELQGGF